MNALAKANVIFNIPESISDIKAIIKNNAMSKKTKLKIYLSFSKTNIETNIIRNFVNKDIGKEKPKKKNSPLSISTQIDIQHRKINNLIANPNSFPS